MCIDPVTGFMLAAATVGAAGDIVEGRNQDVLAGYQAQSLNNEADAERRTSNYQAAREYDKQRYAQAEDRARIGASGVAFTGSAAEVYADNAAQGQLDLEAIRYGSTLKQQQLRTQAGVVRAQGKMAKQASYFSAAGKMLSAGFQAFGGPNAAIKSGGAQGGLQAGAPMNLLSFRRPGIA